jgi:hypothetical protein
MMGLRRRMIKNKKEQYFMAPQAQETVSIPLASVL